MKKAFFFYGETPGEQGRGVRRVLSFYTFTILTLLTTSVFAGYSEPMNQAQQVVIDYPDGTRVTESAWYDRILDAWGALGVWGIPLLTILLLATVWQFRRPISRAMVNVLGKISGDK